MEELSKLRASRRGHRSHLTKIIKKAEEIIAGQQEVTPMVLASATMTIEQLSRKVEILQDLGGRIQEILETPEELEEEIFEHEETQEQIMETKTKLSVFVNTFSLSSNKYNTDTSPSTSTITGVSPQINAASYPHSEINNSPPNAVNTDSNVIGISHAQVRPRTNVPPLQTQGKGNP